MRVDDPRLRAIQRRSDFGAEIGFQFPGFGAGYEVRWDCGCKEGGGEWGWAKALTVRVELFEVERLGGGCADDQFA